MEKLFSRIFAGRKPIIGMVHVKALPGTPLYDSRQGWQYIIDSALYDVEQLHSAGVDGIQIENQWDRPFLREKDLGPETATCLTYIVAQARKATNLPLGMQVHINGCFQAMAIAKASGCGWVRAFELANAYVSNSGYIEAAGPQLMRYRRMIDAEDVMIFGDFHVKHGSHARTADRGLVDQAHDIQEFLGDAAIITGVATGSPPDAETCKRVKEHISIPLLIGSGLSVANLDLLWPSADGAIIGSSFKEGGNLANPIRRDMVELLIEKARKLEKSDEYQRK